MVPYSWYSLRHLHERDLLEPMYRIQDLWLTRNLDRS